MFRTSICKNVVFCSTEIDTVSMFIDFGGQLIRARRSHSHRRGIDCFGATATFYEREEVFPIHTVYLRDLPCDLCDETMPSSWRELAYAERLKVDEDPKSLVRKKRNQVRTEDRQANAGYYSIVIALVAFSGALWLKRNSRKVKPRNPILSIKNGLEGFISKAIGHRDGKKEDSAWKKSRPAELAGAAALARLEVRAYARNCVRINCMYMNGLYLIFLLILSIHIC